MAIKPESCDFGRNLGNPQKRILKEYRKNIKGNPQMGQVSILATARGHCTCPAWRYLVSSCRYLSCVNKPNGIGRPLASPLNILNMELCKTEKVQLITALLLIITFSAIPSSVKRWAFSSPASFLFHNSELLFVSIRFSAVFLFIYKRVFHRSFCLGTFDWIGA